MLKNWMRDLALALQAKSGITPAFFVWLAIVFVAGTTAFVFLCVAAYDWLALQFGAVYAGLIMAGIFVLIALIAALAGAMARRRARERAILARAARAQATSWLLDPKILGAAMQAGRTFGFERIIPIALVGFLAAQWLRDRYERKSEETE
jgi:hypothetical protein